MMMEEDPAYLERRYLLLLEERLRRASKSADDVVHAVNTSGLIVGNFGDNAHILGDCEEKGAKTLLGAEAGGLGQAFRQVGAAATSLRAPAERNARALADRFRAPLKRGLELVQAAKEAIDARADALLKLQTARSKCEQRRVKLEAALANPAPAAPAPAPANGGGWFDTLASVTKLASSAPPTVEEMQKDSEAAAERRREAQERYDAIKATMKTELPRVHADLEADLNAAFASAAQIFANLAAAQAEAWENVMPGCSQVAPLEVPPLPKATDKDSLVSQAWSTVMRGGANGRRRGKRRRRRTSTPTPRRARRASSRRPSSAREERRKDEEEDVLTDETILAITPRRATLVERAISELHRRPEAERTRPRYRASPSIARQPYPSSVTLSFASQTTFRS